MDDSDPPGFPFGGGFPDFGDLGKLFGGGGGDSWNTARQLAVTMATGGESEPNVDPEVRIEIEQLARVAELQVTQLTGLDLLAAQVVPVTRAQWAERTVGDYRELFEKLTGALSQNQPTLPDDPELSGDPMAAMLGQMMQMMGPMMLGMTAGSMVGHLARRSLGHYDVPVPRPGSTEIQLVPANIDEFGEEWSLPTQDLLLWVCIHELTHHAVLSVPHVGGTLRRLLLDYAGGFRPDPSELEERLGGLDLSNPAGLGDLQGMLGDPEVVLGAIQSPEQRAMLPQLHALTAVVVGTVDHLMDQIGDGLIGTYSQLTEALRRRRVEADPSDRFIERILGLELTQEQYERGTAFAAGVVERASTEGLARLWADERHLPTPNEVDAPGLWLARIDLPEDD